MFMHQITFISGHKWSLLTHYHRLQLFLLLAFCRRRGRLVCTVDRWLTWLSIGLLCGRSWVQNPGRTNTQGLKIRGRVYEATKAKQPLVDRRLSSAENTKRLKITMVCCGFVLLCTSILYCSTISIAIAIPKFRLNA